MVSCRFKSTRATDVQAASSAGSMSAGIGESPVPSKARAAAGSSGVLVVVPGEQAHEDGDLFGPGGARKDQSERPVEPSPRVGASLADQAGGQAAGGLDVGRVVQQDEGLEWRVRPRSLDDAFLARRGIEGEQAGVQESALPVGVQAAAVLVLSLVGDVVTPGEIEEDPVARAVGRA